MAAKVVCPCGWTGGPYASAARAEAMAAKHVCKTKRADAVRRATRRHRCARCGYERTYENAGAAEARQHFERHSCRKHEEAMLRAAIHEEKLAAVDRTPKPCEHKVANHQHGTRACYVLDKCRCRPCTDASSAAERERARQKAYGRYNKYVDARPVREHVHSLMDAGMGLKTVAKRTGVSTGTLSKLIYGLYRNTGTGGGRNGKGERIRPPSRRVLRTTAEKLYALDPDWTGQPLPLADGAVLDEDASRAVAVKLQALVAIGWSMSELGRRLGITYATNAIPIVKGERCVTVATACKADALFEELCMTLPPETNRQERTAATRARRYAQQRGWKPPLALEDLDDIEPDDEPYIDKAAIERRLNGDRSIRLTHDEGGIAVRRALARGMSGGQIMRDLGLKVDSYGTVDELRGWAS